MSLIEYQGLIDFCPYLERQTHRLENDAIYPPSLYVHQRMGCEAGCDHFDSEDALATVTEWLAQPEPRFVLLLGDFGTGKSFLLHMLALDLARRDDGPTPVLIEMRGLQKARTLDELVAQHLSGAGETRIDLKAFRYMLAQGRIALLFDGFDELALRVTYERAAEHFDTLIEAAAGRAKVVTTSRTQHFESEEQIKTALAARAERLPGRRIGRLTGFHEPQIRRFLVNRYGSEPEAEARLALIREIRDLFGLAANPRMLGFIADLPEDQLRQARERAGEITAAALYGLLIERWLEHEQSRAEPRGALPALSLRGLREGVTQLALRLWQQAEPNVRLGDLRDEAARLIPRLAVADMDAATAAHQLGSGTLLVRDEEGRFRFIHQSVMEWLVARHAAETLTTGEATALLGRRAVSSLMADFLVALSVEQGAALRDWVRDALDVAATEGEVVKMNALMINERLGDPVRPDANLAGQDLRGQHLSGSDLAGADLRGADLRDTRLAGADLTGARLTGARLAGADLSRAQLRDADLEGADGAGASLLGADLSGARLAGSRWPRAKLVAAQLDIQTLSDGALWGAAHPEADRPHLQYPFADPCTAVAWHATHSILATGHQSGNVRLWDPGTGQALRKLEGHVASVQSVAFSPDGKWLASGSDDKTVRLWDPGSGRALGTIKGHENRVQSVAFSPDGKWLASGSDDKTVRLWDPGSGHSLRTLEGRGGWVQSVAFSPDGKCLASGSRDNTVRLWDPGSGRVLRTLEGHGNSVLSVAFSPDGKWLASGSDDKTVRLWDPGSGQALRTFEGHGEWVQSVAFSPDGKYLASGSRDTTVRLWDLESGRALRTIKGHDEWVQSVVFSPDGKWLASGSLDTTVRLWDLDSGRALRTLEGNGRGVLSVAFSPDGKWLASGSGDQTVSLWDPGTGRVLRTLKGHRRGVQSVVFSPDGKCLASGSADQTVSLWDLDSGRALRTLKGHWRGVLSITFSPDGKWLASGSVDETVSLWDPETGRVLRTLKGHENSVLSIAFSPDGKWLASGSVDSNVRLWDPESGHSLRTLEGRGGGVQSVAFSPNGKLLAMGSWDKSVRLWDPESRQTLRTLKGHGGEVQSVTFSPDGKCLASGSRDKTVRLWDPATGRAPHARRPWEWGFKRRLQPRWQVPRKREFGQHRAPLGPRVGEAPRHAHLRPRGLGGRHPPRARRADPVALWRAATTG